MANAGDNTTNEPEDPSNSGKELVALGRILHFLRESDDSEELVLGVLEYIKLEFDYPIIWVALYDRSNHRLLSKGWFLSENEKFVPPLMINLETGDLLEQVVIQQRPLGVPDLREERRAGEWCQIAQRFDIQGTIIFPIRRRDTCLGLMLMGSRLWGISPNSGDKAKISTVLGALAEALYRLDLDLLELSSNALNTLDNQEGNTQINTGSEEEYIYNHLLYYREKETPRKLIDRFRQLFIDHRKYPDFKVQRSLDRVIQSSNDERIKFTFFLNRCCYILVNYWLLNSKSHVYISELIGLFKNLPNKIEDSAPDRQELHDLVQDFVETEQYLNLERLSRIISLNDQTSEDESNKPLSTLIRRYPYLYEDILLTQHSSQEQREAVWNLRLGAQQEFKANLSHYESIRRIQNSQSTTNNPTLLNTKELDSAIDYYKGRVGKYGTFNDSAERLSSHCQTLESYKEFKEALSDYLLTSLEGIDPTYRNIFEVSLNQFFQSCLANFDLLNLNQFLISETCKKLLDFLIVESSRNHSHFIFVDLISNLGAEFTVGQLMKIVLFCPSVKLYLEQRFAILFNHYSDYTVGSVHWLITILETFNVALSFSFIATRDEFKAAQKTTTEKDALTTDLELGRSYAESGSYEEAISCFQKDLENNSKDNQPQEWALLQYHLANAYFKWNGSDRSDNIEKAIAACKSALQVYTYETFPESWAQTQLLLAKIYTERIRGDRSDNLEKAIAAYESALQIYTREDFPEEWANAQSFLAQAYSNRIRGDRAENLERAIAACESALQVYTRETFPEEWAKAQTNLAIAYSKRFQGDRADNIEQAIAAYESALQIYTHEAFPRDWARTQMGLAEVYFDRIQGDRVGNTGQAIVAYTEAAQVFRQLGLAQELSRTLHNLGLACNSQARNKIEPDQNRERAIEAYIESSQICRQLSLHRDLSITLNNLGAVYFDSQQFEEAIRSWNESLTICQEQSDSLNSFDALSYLGNAYRDLSEYQQSFDCLQQALNIARDVGGYYHQLKALNNLGNTYYYLNEYQQALNCYQEALPIAQEWGDHRSESLTLIGLADAYQALGNYQQSVDLYEQALATSQQITDEELGISIQSKLAKALLQSESFERAIAVAQSIPDQEKRLEILTTVVEEVRRVGGDRAEELLSLLRSDPDERIRQTVGQILETYKIPPNNIPSGVVEFLGRETQLSAIHRLLQEQGILAISGSPGVGKTSLAIQYSITQLSDYSGGICWLRANESDLESQILRFGCEKLCLPNVPSDAKALVDQEIAPNSNGRVQFQGTYWFAKAIGDITIAVDESVYVTGRQDLVLNVIPASYWKWDYWNSGDVLLVFDDVDSINKVLPYLPPNQSRFKIILITQLKLDFSTLSPVPTIVLNEIPNLEVDEEQKQIASHSPFLYSVFLRTSSNTVSVGSELEISICLTSLTEDETNVYLMEIASNEAIGNELNILINAPGFRLENDNSTSLPFDPDATSQVTDFHLIALRPGSSKITAELYRGDTFETTLEKTIQVVGLEESDFLNTSIKAEPRPVSQPDLVLQVQTLWNETASICTFRYHLRSFRGSSLLSSGITYQSPPLSDHWHEQVHELLKNNIEVVSDALPAGGRSYLISLGQYLFQHLFPAELQADLRNLNRYQSHTLLILADQDAQFPWTLLHNGQEFLGERFIMGHWLWDLNNAHPYEFPVGAINVAHYANVEQPEVWATLLEPPGAPPPLILTGGVLDDLGSIDAMRGLHLLRVGQSAADAERQDAPVPLEAATAEQDIDQKVRPIKLNLRRNRPLVTLGYLRQDQPELTHLQQTWAATFIRAGCSAFVGSLWAVNPSVEAAFMSSFYHALWMGDSLGGAFHTARRLARATVPDSLDWLAYLLFGDPMARPYRPVQGQGYAVVEPIGQDINDPVSPGTTIRFRVSLRRTPPVWHEERVIEVAETLIFNDLQAHIVTFGLQVTPATSIPLRPTPSGNYLGWFNLIVPPDITGDSALIQVYFADGMQTIHTLTFPLTFQPAGGHPA